MNPPPSKILVVDDDAGVRQAIRLILEADFEVQMAPSVRQARELFETESKWAAVISDYHLTDGTGLGLYAWIREQSSVPFLLITGGIPSAPINTPTFGFLRKPFNGPALQKGLNHLLEASRRFEIQATA